TVKTAKLQSPAAAGRRGDRFMAQPPQKGFHSYVHISHVGKGDLHPLLFLSRRSQKASSRVNRPTGLVCSSTWSSKWGILVPVRLVIRTPCMASAPQPKGEMVTTPSSWGTACANAPRDRRVQVQ